MTASVFDAVVVGSGITGGWAAKELTERGLKVLVVERGSKVEHGVDYPTENAAPWDMAYRGFGAAAFAGDPVLGRKGGLINGLVNEYNGHFFTRFADAPYQTADGRPFEWVRGHQLGGRSLTWSRQALRWSALDFEANKADGHGDDWPIRYEDLAPWYDRVEEVVGVSGEAAGLDQLPDGRFQPAMPLLPIEERFKAFLAQKLPDRTLIHPRTANLTRPLGDRAACQYRDQCSRGCSYGAYFSSLSSTLPIAARTGLLTVLTDMIAEKLIYDPERRRVTAVQIVDAATGERRKVEAKLFVLCASALASVQILLNSRDEAMPLGLGGGSGVLGRYVMDHPKTVAASGVFTGLDDRAYTGRRPANPIIPRFRNLDSGDHPFKRGYFFNFIPFRLGWSRGAFLPGIGGDFKESLGRPGPWAVALPVFAECLPYADNRVELDGTATDRWGIPQLRIDVRYRENEQRLLDDARDEAVRMLKGFGAIVMGSSTKSNPPGGTVHEMGGARMGADPARSVVNRWNQVHDAPNVLVTDGAAMASSASQNPSLTYMAMTARATAHAVDLLREGQL